MTGGELQLATGAGDVVEASPVLSMAEQLATLHLLPYRGHTLEAYRTDLLGPRPGKRAPRGGDRSWFGFCRANGLDPLEARRAHVDLWVRSLDDLKPATVARKVTAVAGFYATAVDEDVLDRSPVPSDRRRLQLRKVPRKSQTLGPDRAECKALLEAARRHSARDLAVVSLLLHLGLRVSELVGADEAHLGRERGHWTLTVTRKGGEEQTLVITPTAYGHLEEYQAADTAQGMLVLPVQGGPTRRPLVRDEQGRRLDRFQVLWIIARTRKAAGVTKAITPHGLRHAVTTQLLDEGVPMRDVQVYLGHASPVTTQRYDLGREQLDKSPAYALTGVFTT